jgi:hypothetical protein
VPQSTRPLSHIPKQVPPTNITKYGHTTPILIYPFPKSFWRGGSSDITKYSIISYLDLLVPTLSVPGLSCPYMTACQGSHNRVLPNRKSGMAKSRNHILPCYSATWHVGARGKAVSPLFITSPLPTIQPSNASTLSSTSSLRLCEPQLPELER